MTRRAGWRGADAGTFLPRCAGGSGSVAAMTRLGPPHHRHPIGVALRALGCAAILGLWPLAAALAEGERSGAFDHWVLALSWSPSWCARADAGDAAEQCDPAADFGWILHGLWPQYADGWPSYCRAAPAPPSRAQTRAMADIMGSAGLAWHQWKKHGSCAGLPASAYFALARRAFAGIALPDPIGEAAAPARMSAAAIEASFLAANPGFAPETVTVTCRDGRLQELRLCLDRERLDPIACGRHAARDCTGMLTVPPIP